MAEKELRSIQFPGLEDRYVVPEGGGGGATGPAGKDGLTPTIGANGNWYLGDEDTGKPSRGEQGPAGERGPKGEPGPPAVTAADNGKFLRVVNGFWTAEAVPSAGGASF